MTKSTATASKSKAKPVAPKGPTKAQLAKSKKMFGEQEAEDIANAPQHLNDTPVPHKANGGVSLERPPRATAPGRRASDVMAFSMQQLSVPTAPQPKPVMDAPAAAISKFNEELELLKQKHNIPSSAGIVPQLVTPDTPPREKAAKVQRNGVTRPGENTLCGKIWAAADELSAASKSVASIAALKDHAATKGVNDHTIKTQYARWRLFNGIKGRMPTIHTVQQVAAPWNPPFGNVPEF